VANADRIIDLLHEAKARPAGAERENFLAEACRDDMDLKAQILSLLEADASDDDTQLLKISGMIHPIVVPAEKPGDRIGRYKILEQIGEGGCGVVYIAEQEEPVRRRVALKVIKLGMDTKQVMARFDAERQALAMMDHPNIAKVLDAGATDTGRPYFVMELVRGIKITDYCEQNHVLPRERLDLFIQVCRAIQHAHQKGIIHRDIKPSNILVASNDGVAVPKVIDFGIAKATQGRLTDQTVYTAFEQFIGTPAYMSPEQAQLTMQDVDTRTDIYSLGVLLYELLTGTTPFEAKELLSKGLDEMRRTIREVEPVKPSTRLTQTVKSEIRSPKSGSKSADHNQSEISSDLDWIVMKCLEKDRTRRYETANGIATDINRHLQNEPIAARPPSRSYQFQKLVRRNKLAFVAAGAVVAALVLGLGISTWMFFKEKQARQRAVAAEQAQSRLRQEAEIARAAEAKLRIRAEADEQQAKTEAAKSEQVAQFLKDMLVGVGPWVAKGRDTTVLREIVDRTAERVGKDLNNQPEVEWELRNTIGAIYRELSQPEKAEAVLKDAPAAAKRLYGGESLKAAALLHNLALALNDQNKLDKAEPLLREVLAMRRKHLGNEDLLVAMTLHDLANTLHYERKWAEAEVIQREALALVRKVTDTDNTEVAVALDHLAIMLRDQGRLAEAEPLFRESLGMYRKVRGDDNPAVAEVLGTLASVLRQQGKLAEAEGSYREALPMCRKFFGDESRAVGWAVHGFASLLKQQGKLGEAEAAYREALTICRKAFGNESREVGWVVNGLGETLTAQGKLTEAETLCRQELASAGEPATNNQAKAEILLAALAKALRRQSKNAEAEPLFRQALAIARQLATDDAPTLRRRINDLADVLQRQGKLADAEALKHEAEALTKGQSPAPPK
jgi:serine/threonine protein kinase